MPFRSNKPRDLDLAELVELLRNVPDSAQKHIERYAAQEVERRTTTRLSRSQALRAAFAIVFEKRVACGGRREVIAAIPPGPLLRKILTHPGLPTTAVTRRPRDVWQVRGPSGELVPGDFADMDVADAVEPPADEDLDLPFWDDPLNDAGICAAQQIRSDAPARGPTGAARDGHGRWVEILEIMRSWSG